MLPLSKNLFVNQGSDFTETLEFRTKENNSFDLTGYELFSTIKQYYNTSTIFESGIRIVEPIGGVAEINISNTVTSMMNAERYVYSVKAVKDNFVLTLAFGQILMGRF